MIKKIIIILIIFNVTKIVKASTKDGIIINLKKIKNISFDFKQTVDEKIEDGKYLLNLQIPSFISDAAPSRPLIFKLNDI